MFVKNKYYKLKEIAKILGVDARTVRIELKGNGGNIPYLAIGRQKTVVVLGKDILKAYTPPASLHNGIK